MPAANKKAVSDAAGDAATAQKPSLLIVDEDELIQNTLIDFFEESFFVISAHSRNDVKSVLVQYADRPLDYALVDLGLPPLPHEATEGFAVISALQSQMPQCAIVVVSGQDVKRHGQRARSLGAADYAEKPCSPTTLKEKLLRAKESQRLAHQSMGLVGESPPIKRLREQIAVVGAVSFPVLITGESGVGKEVVAQALHKANRSGRAFLAVNCATIPDHLVEPTLFGYARGSFTGAHASGAGYFGDVGNGTLFLDEINDLPDTVQPKLLRVLETGEYSRVGETQSRQCAARIIAASKYAHPREASNRMRDDLYYRISVFSIAVPPLHSLGADKFLLMSHFRDMVAGDMASEPFALSADAETLWADYVFPGNVRELKNIVARLQVQYPGQTVSAAALAAEMATETAPAKGGRDLPPQLVKLSPLSALPKKAQEELMPILSDLGYRTVQTALAESGGNAATLAAQLGLAAADAALLLRWLAAE